MECWRIFYFVFITMTIERLIIDKSCWLFDTMCVTHRWLSNHQFITQQNGPFLTICGSCRSLSRSIRQSLLIFFHCYMRLYHHLYSLYCHSPRSTSDCLCCYLMAAIKYHDLMTYNYVSTSFYLFMDANLVTKEVHELIF